MSKVKKDLRKNYMSRIVNETHNTSCFVPALKMKIKPFWSSHSLQSSDKGGGGDESKDGHDEDVEPVLAVWHAQVARHDAGNEALSQANHPEAGRKASNDILRTHQSCSDHTYC